MFYPFRFRDKFNNDLKERNFFCSEKYSDFSVDFDKILRVVETSSSKAQQSGRAVRNIDLSFFCFLLLLTALWSHPIIHHFFCI